MATSESAARNTLSLPTHSESEFPKNKWYFVWMTLLSVRNTVPGVLHEIRFPNADSRLTNVKIEKERYTHLRTPPSHTNKSI